MKRRKIISKFYKLIICDRDFSNSDDIEITDLNNEKEGGENSWRPINIEYDPLVK